MQEKAIGGFPTFALTMPPKRCKILPTLKNGVLYMKKYLSILLSVLLLCTMLPLGAVSVSAENVYECLKYTIKDDKVTITGCTKDLPANVVIPETIEGYPVTELGSQAFYYASAITSVIIPDSVTTIGKWAFYYCSSLMSIIIPDNVTTIEEKAFYHCKSLTSATIGDSVTTIGNNAFYNCISLSSVTIGSSVTTIGDWAFYYCYSLTALTLPSSVTTIGNHAFSMCGSLTSMIIPDSVTTIGESAFGSCHNITSLTIGNGVTNIGKSAFSTCSALNSLTIGNSVTTIGEGAFSDCGALTSVTIPDSVKTIGNNAFRRCDSLTSATIGSGVTTIGESAFYDCKALTAVTIPDNVTTIEDRAFYNCRSLTAVTIPNSVTTIGDSAFESCYSITTVIIGSNVSTIGAKAFHQCTALNSFIVDENNAYYCNADDALFSKDKTVLVRFPNRKDGIYTIPNSVTTIEAWAFSLCSSLTSIIIPDSVTTIGTAAFWNCFCLNSVIVDTNNSCYRDIDGILFSKDQTALVKYPDAKSTIANTYTVPDSVTIIGDYAFSLCRHLSSVTTGNNITTIGEYAFYNCQYLSSLILSNSVTTIGKEAFNVSNRLAVVYYGGSAEDRANITIGTNNNNLLKATWHYNYINPEDRYSPDVENSVMDTEDGSGLAYKFELKLNGLKAVQGNKVDFTNATVNYKGTICKVVAMGAILSNVENKKMELSDVNGTNTIDVPVVYLQDLEPDSCQFAVRIINIPESALDRTIYARPYYVIETPDGDTVTVYGKISSASCAEYM